MIGHETRMVRSVVCVPPSRWSAIRGQSRSVDSQVPQPTFGSGLGLQCVYTVVISL